MWLQLRGCWNAFYNQPGIDRNGNIILNCLGLQFQGWPSRPAADKRYLPGATQRSKTKQNIEGMGHRNHFPIWSIKEITYCYLDYWWSREHNSLPTLRYWKVLLLLECPCGQKWLNQLEIWIRYSLVMAKCFCFYTKQTFLLVSFKLIFVDIVNVDIIILHIIPKRYEARSTHSYSLCVAI